MVTSLGAASRCEMIMLPRTCKPILTTSWPKGRPFCLPSWPYLSTKCSPVTLRTQMEGKGLKVTNLGGEIYTQIPHPFLSSSQNHCQPLCGCMQDFLRSSRGSSIEAYAQPRPRQNAGPALCIRSQRAPYCGCSRAHPKRNVPRGQYAECMRIGRDRVALTSLVIH